MSPDEDEVYDVSYKKYTGFTTSGKTKIFYSTYARANEIGVTLNNVEYSKSNLDGCSCELIEGVSYRYIQEDRNEYLVLNINKAMPLSNWQYLLRNDPNPGHENIKELKKKERIYTIQAGSVVVFAINRK